jgi:hypothetical protein
MCPGPLSATVRTGTLRVVPAPGGATAVRRRYESPNADFVFRIRVDTRTLTGGESDDITGAIPNP